MNPNNLINQVIHTAEEAAQFIRENFGRVSNTDVEIKGLNSLVSYVDKKAEELIVQQLSEVLPNSGFLTEEDTIDRTNSEYVWVIDPLDGTTNFLYNIPHFSVSIALRHNDQLVLGVIVDVMTNSTYSAVRGHGAFKNGKPIQVDSRRDFSEAVIATGFPYESDYDKTPYFKMMEHVMREARGLRRFGSAALDLAFVAEGRFQAFYETSLNPWDVAAGIVIVEEANGICIPFFSSQNDCSNGKTIIAGHQNVASRIQNLTDSYYLVDNFQ